jgi:hypothetical protein
MAIGWARSLPSVVADDDRAGREFGLEHAQHWKAVVLPAVDEAF